MAEDFIPEFKPTHQAAVCIIEAVAEDGYHFPFEEKDEGYPVANFRGTYSIIGGNWRYADDKSPRGTVIRELGEELVGSRCQIPENAVLLSKVMKNMVPYGEFHIWVPKETSGTKDFNFVATAFRSNISEFYNSNVDFFKKGISSTESTRKITTLSQKELEYPTKPLRFCWYDRVLEQYFKKLGIEANIEFFSGAYAARLDRDPASPTQTG